MSRLPWGRIVFILIILGVSVLITLLKPIKLGLDLQGGSHLLIRVHADEAVEKEVDDTFAAVKNAFNENNIGFTDAKDSIVFNQALLNRKLDPFKQLDDPANKRPYVEFTLTDAEKMAQAQEEINKRVSTGGNGDWDLSTRGSATIRLSLRTEAVSSIRAATLENVRRSIAYRVDQLGVAEPNIVIQGDPQRSQRILLQLPGVDDPEEAKDRIQTPGNLEFRMVVYDDSNKPYRALTRKDLLKNIGGEIPGGTEPVPEYARTETEAKGVSRVPVEWFLLYKEAPVNSNYLIDAKTGRDRQQGVTVNFTFNAEGGDRFRKMTRANVNKLMAIVLDDEAIEVATINDEIGSEGQITGRFTKDSANRLSWLLRTGAVPTSMHVVEERSVGPSLGRDSIRLGVTAAIWGMVFVVLFMIVYYRLSGFVAVFALTMNLVLITAFLAWFGAVLTLPGIAGIILTIGMAVDANVLIFQRIREELHVGKTVASSIEGGFGKAFSTIFDANVTTLIAAIFLFQFGTGPIRGFATTITIGILASMFTAIFVARVIFDSFLSLKRRQVQKLSI